MAELDVTTVAADVTADGAECVVNVSKEPKAVPSALESIAQKK